MDLASPPGPSNCRGPGFLYMSSIKKLEALCLNNLDSSVLADRNSIKGKKKERAREKNKKLTVVDKKERVKQERPRIADQDNSQP